MNRIHFTSLFGAFLATLSWIVIGLLVLILFRAFLTGQGWIYLD
jgi:hypothetical protein